MNASCPVHEPAHRPARMAVIAGGGIGIGIGIGIGKEVMHRDDAIHCARS